MVYLRSTLGRWSSQKDLKEWTVSLGIDGRFDIPGHFKTQAHNNRTETNESVTRYFKVPLTKVRKTQGVNEVFAEKKCVELFKSFDAMMRNVIDSNPTSPPPVQPPEKGKLPPHDWSSNDEKEEQELDDTYTTAKRRMNQSKFRRKLNEIFGNKCCLTKVDDPDLLVASHIVRWADDPTARLDPSNGLLLYCEYDQMFEEGYFYFDENRKAVISLHGNRASKFVQARLIIIEGKQLPDSVNVDYLIRHRARVTKLRGKAE